MDKPVKHRSLAAHSYFHVTNKADQKRRFLEEGQRNPQFSYRDHFDMTVVQGHMDGLDQEDARRSLELVLASIKLQQADLSDSAKREFRSMNKKLFGAPNEAYVCAILKRVSDRVTPETKPLWDYVMRHIDCSLDDAPAIIPDHDMFTRYHEYFETYHDALPHLHGGLMDKLQQMLSHTELDKKGWSIRMVDDLSHARIDHSLKRVSIGMHYTPRTPKAADRIVVHEIYGHAKRGPQPDIAESEGVAVLLEQLLDSRFMFRRAYRYMAAALGWGIGGKPRTFRQVYEIMWRLMVIASRYSEENAKSYAFDECARVFRGGRPDVAGMVFLKDAVYFAANIAVWQKLIEEPLEYNEFVDVIEGRRKVLS